MQLDQSVARLREAKSTTKIGRRGSTEDGEEQFNDYSRKPEIDLLIDQLEAYREQEKSGTKKGMTVSPDERADQDSL